MKPLVIALSLSLPILASAEDLTCLKEKDVFYARLQKEATAALNRRDEAYEKLKTPEEIAAYQKNLREFFLRQLGPLPERGPLNPQVAATLKGDGYRIENVIFESQPNHHITANFYIPDGPGPFPGAIVSSGHSRTAKTADYNQRFGIALVKQGIATLCFDPIGQGERSQILDGAGQPQFSGTTDEHFLIGVGSILVGRNTATYRVWDAMRAIDYLQSRPEVDPKRIGMTGCSGGGTLTSYVMALDGRVTCAAPACYLTTFQRLLDTIGPQDAEQNIFGQLANGLDQPDYVILRAPKPTLISATTEDFFDFKGSWENFRQAKRLYGRLGFPERVDLVEVEGKHGVQPQNLATIAHWMRRWLVGKDEPVAVAEYATRPESELLCVGGQVLRLAGELSVFELNGLHEKALAAKRGSVTADRVRETIGAKLGDPQASPKWDDIGTVARPDYHIDKLVLQPASGRALPALTFHPEHPEDDAYLYLHDGGKTGDSAPGGAIEKLVMEDYAVVSVDLSGQGETADNIKSEHHGSWKTYYLAYLLGHSLTGLRTEDALEAGRFVAYYQKEKSAPRKVHLVGVGQAGIVALHAAALQPELFASVTLKGTPKDWASIVRQPVPTAQLEYAVHGVLAVYDLPDLVKLAGEAKVRFE